MERLCVRFIYDKCKLTDNARINYEQRRQRYSCMKTSAYVLVKILKIYKTEYYERVIKPLLTTDCIIYDIDLNDSFDLKAMIEKADKREYKTCNEVLSDLSRIIRRVDSDTIYYLKKNYDPYANRYTIAYVNQQNMKDMLKSVKLWKEENKRLTAWDVMENNLSKLLVSGVKFYTDDKKNFCNL